MAACVVSFQADPDETLTAKFWLLGTNTGTPDASGSATAHTSNATWYDVTVTNLETGTYMFVAEDESGVQIAGGVLQHTDDTDPELVSDYCPSADDVTVSAFTTAALSQLGSTSLVVSLSVPAASQAAASAQEITILRGDTLDITWSGMDVDDVSEGWFTVKESTDDADSAAKVQITKTGGLLYINGEAAGTSDNGTWVSDATANTVRVTCTPAEMAKLTWTARNPSGVVVDYAKWHYDLQVKRSTGKVVTLASDDATVTADVTKATS